MLKLVIDDWDLKKVFVFESEDKEDFMNQILNNALVQLWLDSAEDDEGQKVFGEDYEWNEPDLLVRDICKWACNVAMFEYSKS